MGSNKVKVWLLDWKRVNEKEIEEKKESCNNNNRDSKFLQSHVCPEKDRWDLYLREDLPAGNASRLLMTPGSCDCQQELEKGVNVWMEVLWEGAKKRRLFHTKHEGERLSIYHKLIPLLFSPQLQMKQHICPDVAVKVPACDKKVLNPELSFGQRQS